MSLVLIIGFGFSQSTYHPNQVLKHGKGTWKMIWWNSCHIKLYLLDAYLQQLRRGECKAPRDTRRNRWTQWQSCRSEWRWWYYKRLCSRSCRSRARKAWRENRKSCAMLCAYHGSGQTESCTKEAQLKNESGLGWDHKIKLVCLPLGSTASS